MDIDSKQAKMTPRLISVAIQQQDDMNSHPEINWSLVCRRAIHRKLIKLSKEKES